MHGNVWEWVWDWIYNYSSSPVPDPISPSSGDRRVVCGGSISNSGDPWARSAKRGYTDPEEINAYIGFRLVRDL
jgi:formylglycine-generating enzyme required for sulfatase activity